MNIDALTALHLAEDIMGTLGQFFHSSVMNNNSDEVQVFEE